MTEGEKTNGSKGGEGDTTILDTSTTSEHDPQFEPIITLPEVVVPTLEENEEEMIQLRAKLYRFDSSGQPSEWKERGTGNVKLLRHTVTNSVRVVMRRDKTHKICANHFVSPWMVLSPNCGSDRAWVWSVLADLTFEKANPELFAIRFATAEQAQLWKTKFEEAKKIVAERCDFCKEEHEEDEDDDGSASEDDNDESATKEDQDSSQAHEDSRCENPEEEVTQKLKELDVGSATANISEETSSAPSEKSPSEKSPSEKSPSEKSPSEKSPAAP